ncbi:uncharacterized protein A4U43_C01F31100 [Asparagus officinalis]|uniref:60S ribosomal protein L18a-like protein n=1 Tax=Asparagus officinalis TaxID=4686 RepID=A0A5P1FU50_ASPOF|nr:60S ribosomal protein L18a-like protein isoform X2 [Asparagus officinalis]ONK81612.1 uncharacterized protein A4U43_C01F31100 [Asparagus officinalis]
MAMKGEERDPIKIPISNPHHGYGTFPQTPAPSAPLLYPQQQQHQQQHPFPYHSTPVGYQPVPYTVGVQEGIPVTQPRLPFCGIGVGWALFLAGFFLAAIPWYVGVFILVFVSQDYREKLGLVACTVAAALATLPFILKPFHEIFGW